MNSQDISLLQLMRLREGQLEAGQARALRERIDGDQRWMQRWRQVEQAYRSLAGGPQRNGRRVEDGAPGNPMIDPSEVAAYIEGRLNASESLDFEAVCWLSPEQLVEVLDAFRFYCTSHGHQRISASLTARLVELADWEDATIPEPCRPRTSPSREPEPPPLISPPAAQPMPQRARQSSRTRRARHWAIAAVLALVTLGVTAVLLQRVTFQTADPSPAPRPAPNHSEPRETNDGDEETEQPPQPGESTPSIEEPQSFPRLIFPDREMRRLAVDPDRPEEQPPLPLIDESIARPEEEQSPIEPSASQQVALSIQWQTIRGLLAVRDRRSQKWVGPDYDPSGVQAEEIVTMPQSWAVGSSDELGEFVLGNDSRVRLSRSDESSPSITAVVQRGQLAFRKLPQDAELSVTANGAEWRVHVGQANTTVAIDTLRDEPRLMVRRGAVEIQDVQVTRGQQVFGSYLPNLRPQPIEGSLTWVDRPERAVRVSDEMRDSLLASDDVLGDLDRFVSSAGPAHRATMIGWSTALEMDSSLMQWLNSSDGELRETTLKWMLSQDLSDPRTRRAWAQLARQTGEPPSVRSIVNWGEMARTGKHLSAEEARKMVQMLNNSHLIFRHASAFFLEMAFGNPHRFQPDAPAAQRRRIAQQWGAEISRQYQRARSRQQNQQRSDVNTSTQRTPNRSASGATQRAPTTQAAPSRSTRSNSRDAGPSGR